MTFKNLNLDLLEQYFTFKNTEGIEKEYRNQSNNLNEKYRLTLRNGSIIVGYNNGTIQVQGQDTEKTKGILKKLSEVDKTIFIVYSFSNGKFKDEIKKYLEDWNLKVEVMDEQENRGQLLLEKLEKSIEKSHYGLVLLSADDKVGEDKYYPRPNVMFEWGMLLGYLKDKKHRVSVINCAKDEVQIASDVLGIAYTLMDYGSKTFDENKFKKELFKEVVHLYNK